MLALFYPQEGYLAALHDLEALLEVWEGSLIVHYEVIGNFSLLVQIDELAIVEACLVSILHSVGVFCERSFTLYFCDNLY